MISKNTIIIITLATLSLTACGGGNTSSAGRRTSIDLASLGYDKYRQGKFICPDESTGSCQERTDRLISFESFPQEIYSQLMNCVANPSGSYNPGNTGANYSGTPSLTDISDRLESCCRSFSELHYHDLDEVIEDMEAMPATTNLKLGEVIINKVNEELFNYACFVAPD